MVIENIDFKCAFKQNTCQKIKIYKDSNKMCPLKVMQILYLIINLKMTIKVVHSFKYFIKHMNNNFESINNFGIFILITSALKFTKKVK